MFVAAKRDDSSFKKKEKDHKKRTKEDCDTDLDFFEEKEEDGFNGNFFMNYNMINNFYEKNEEEVYNCLNEYNNLEILLQNGIAENSI